MNFEVIYPDSTYENLYLAMELFIYYQVVVYLSVPAKNPSNLFSLLLMFVWFFPTRLKRGENPGEILRRQNWVSLVPHKTNQKNPLEGVEG